MKNQLLKFYVLFFIIMVFVFGSLACISKLAKPDSVSNIVFYEDEELSQREEVVTEDIKEEHNCDVSNGYVWGEAENKCIKSEEESFSVGEYVNNLLEEEEKKKPVFVKDDKIYFYGRERGFMESERINIELEGIYISFKGDIDKLYPSPFERFDDMFGYGFGYDGVGIEVNQFLCPYAVCEYPDKITYECDGPSLHIRNEDPFSELIVPTKWEYCETNNTDYLSQYEFSPANRDGFSTGGGFGYRWYKLYIKKFNDNNIFLSGYLKGDYIDSDYMQEGVPSSYKVTQEEIDRIASKEYLDEILQDEENKEYIKKWDEFVEGVEFVDMGFGYSLNKNGLTSQEILSSDEEVLNILKDYASKETIHNLYDDRYKEVLSNTLEFKKKYTILELKRIGDEIEDMGRNLADSIDANNFHIIKTKFCIAKSISYGDLRHTCGINEGSAINLEGVNDITAVETILPFFITGFAYYSEGDFSKANYYFEQIKAHRQAGIDQWGEEYFLRVAGPIYEDIYNKTLQFLSEE